VTNPTSLIETYEIEFRTSAEISGPEWSKHDLVSGSKWVVADLKRLHPDLDGRATVALEWWPNRKANLSGPRRNYAYAHLSMCVFP